MTKFKKDELERLQELNKKHTYTRKIWETTETYTLEEWTQVEPILAYCKTNPYIGPKKRKDGGVFLKMIFPLGGKNEFEAELPYNTDNGSFEEDDEINLSSVHFCVETSIEGKEHLYATGTIVEE